MNKFFKSIASLDIFQVLSHPPFLNFTLSVVFSQMAINMMNIVLIFLIFHITKSNFAVSMLVMVILIPQVVLSFIGGIYADLTNRRRILIIGNLLRAFILIVLVFNADSRLLVYIVALAVSIITQFYTPAETPLIPNLVKHDKLIAANSIFGICLFGSILLGYIVAGPSIQHLGRENVFILLSLLFGAAALFTFLIPQKASEPEHDHSGAVTTKIRKSLREEFQHVVSLLRYTSEAGGAFSLLIASQVIIWVLSTVVPGYALQILGVPAEDLSIFLFAPAALGMIVASILIGTRFTKTNKHKLMNTGIFISAFSLIFFPSLTLIAGSTSVRMINVLLPKIIEINSISLVLFIAFTAGFANGLISVPSQTIIQTVVPESSRSKIFGLLFALIGGFSLIPIILAGGIADLFGVGTVLVIMGFAIFGIGLFRLKHKFILQ